MSSEYSTHLGDRLIRSQVDSLDDLACTTIKINLDAKDGAWASNEQIVFFAGDDRLLEMSLLFRKIAQDLAALLPDDSDADARCRGCNGLLIHNTGCLDTIPIDDVREAVEPPHRWG